MLIPYNRLSEEQKGIIRRISREDGNLFVEGPPGSGKTLISLYTLRDIVENSAVKPLLLMYNHSLYGYLRTAMEELNISDNITIATKDKYFWDLAREYGISAPSGSYEEKYTYLLNNLLKENVERRYDITVVDEVQDILPQEWRLIKKLSKKITSLGDFDQGIYETKLTRLEVSERGLIEKLTEIFRFHKNIAKFASIFSRSKDDLSQKVTRTSQTQPQIFESRKNVEFAKIAEIIKGLEQSRQRIGVISADREELKGLASYLREEGIDYNYYIKNKDLRSHNFTSKVPLLISSFSAKGLEFEHVILFGFNRYSSMIEKLKRENRLKDVIYVSITRTNSNLYIVTNEETIVELKNLEVDEEGDVEDISLDDLF